MKIECLIKRKGGSVITFGHKPREVKYHFKPESDVLDMPHECEVENPVHVQRLLGIPEAYRIAGAPYPDEEDESVADGGKADVYADAFESLHTVNPDAVDNKWLEAFATRVLDVSPTNKTKIAEFLKSEWAIDVKPARETAVGLIRMALVECVREAKADVEQQTAASK